MHGLELHHQVLELLPRAPLHQPRFLLRLERLEWGDTQNVPDPDEAETLGQQDDIHRLVPGHVNEPDGDLPIDLLPRDDVEVGDLGDQAQDVRDVGILEVERDASPVVVLLVIEATLLENVDGGRLRRSREQWVHAEGR